MLTLIKILIYYPFINILNFFTWLFPGHNAVWGIIFLTLLVRLILIIPTRKAAQGQRKLSQLQPLMEELKVEYGDDRQGLANAQMELYRKNNINPFSSCGFALVQIPLLYLLYFTILHGLTPNNPHLYAWLPRPDHIGLSFFGMDLTKPNIFHIGSLALPGILAIGAAAMQFVQMRMIAPARTAGAATDPSVAMQQQSMYLFPLLTLAVAYRLPAGAAIYWIINTTVSVVQQRNVNKEKFALTGVSKAVAVAEKAHPERADVKKDKEIVKELAETTTKKGVSVTVRKKK